MIKIGYHIPISVGYEHMVKQCKDAGGDSFAFYTRDPKGMQTYKMETDDVLAMSQQLQIEGKNMGPIVAHASYTMNLCFPDDIIRERAVSNFIRELELLHSLPSAYYNMHPGSHAGQGKEKGIELIANALNEILEYDIAVQKGSKGPVVLLETMPGKGGQMGGSFEEMAQILDAVNRPERIGFCMDTCHIWDGGYDIKSNPEKVLDRWDSLIGLHKIHAIHLNDSLYALDAHMDTHAKIGHGRIGAEPLKYFVRHPKLQDIPFILETPGDADSHRQEISMIREWSI